MTKQSAAIGIALAIAMATVGTMGQQDAIQQAAGEQYMVDQGYWPASTTGEQRGSHE